MSQEERNTGLLREAYGRWAACKNNEAAIMAAAEHWVSLFADKVDFGSMGAAIDALKFSRSASTRAEVAQYLADISLDWEMVDYVVKDYVAQGDRVVALCDVAWKNRHTRKVVFTPKADSWRFSSEGQVIGYYEYFDTAAAAAGTVA